MTRFLFIFSLVTSGAILSFIYPVLLPIGMTNGIDLFVQKLFLWDTILPVLTLFQAIAFIVLITACIWVYKLFKLLLG